jgi:hypothetical protein
VINDKPFYAFVNMSGVMTWDRGQKPMLAAWLRKLAGTTGAELVVFVADKAWLKTRQQEKGLHAMLAPLAKEKGWAIEDLKRYFLGKTFGYTTSQIDGTEILVEPHTSKLTKAQYSELIERCLELAAEDFDFWLTAPSEWTAQHRQKGRVA